MQGGEAVAVIVVAADKKDFGFLEIGLVYVQACLICLRYLTSSYHFLHCYYY